MSGRIIHVTTSRLFSRPAMEKIVEICCDAEVFQMAKEVVGPVDDRARDCLLLDYGFSDRLSQGLARGLTKRNTVVEMLDLILRN